MNERISTLMDGEESETELSRSLNLIRSSADLRRTWDTYHLIGDALRGHVVPATAARVAERLAAEPTVLAPRRGAPARGAVQRAFSVAAGAAGIAMVVWLALPLLKPEPQQIAATAAPSPAAVPVAVNVDNYLLAHQGFSPAAAMQGVVPYVRTVSDKRAGGEK